MQFNLILKQTSLLALIGTFAYCAEAQVPRTSSSDLQARVNALKSTSPSIVDGIMENSQLAKRRRQSTFDGCLSDKPIASFQDAIEIAVRASIGARKIESNVHIDRAYGLNPERSVPVGLISHPICEQDAAQVEHILGRDRTPDLQTIEMLKAFARESNQDRLNALRGDDVALQRFSSRWTLFMGCLAYAESLQTSDAGPAHTAFAELMDQNSDLKSFYGANATRSAVKPDGVHFGVDRAGTYFIELRKARAEGRATPEFMKELDKKYPSWAVTGLYQFDPKPYGNITPCIDQWNNIVSKPECKIRKGNARQSFLSFASYGQSVNAFCGAQKIVQAFNSQANTTNTSGTDLSNVVNGRIKRAQDRCVGLVARGGTGRVYAHFGPLGNSVRDNLKKLMTCVERAQKALK